MSANAMSQPTAHTESGLRPFSVGEELTYKVRFGKIPVGTARMSVAGIEDVRGRPTFHLVFTIDGGLPLLRVHDRYDSWIDTLTLASRRHVQEIREGRYTRNRHYEIFPEERKYRENDDTLMASVDLPLDEGSFIYFIRTVRVPVGQTREFQQYFKPDRNPVVIRAIRRDTVEVPSGRYPTVVVRPTIRANGIFAEDGQAELWISDDARRMLVRMESKFAGFSLSLSLTDVKLGF
ncbi:MAG: DUF3108 domain-containing protein [bacterium]